MAQVDESAGGSADAKNLQTNVPRALAVHLKQLAVLHDGTLTAMYQRMMDAFLKYKPWAATPAYDWRFPPCSYTRTGDTKKSTGWVVTNLALRDDQKIRILEELETINRFYPARKVVGHGNIKETPVVLRVFAYTAISWWVEYVYPTTQV